MSLSIKMASPFDPHSLVQHRDFMRALARSLLADEHRAEDVVQEASLALLRRSPTEASRGVSQAWLARVVKNFALRIGKRESERGWREDRAVRLADRSEEGERGRPAIGDELDTLSDVADALRALPDPYRSTLYLRFYKDLPPRAIADQEGISIETVRTRLRRGLELLRASLDASHDGDRNAWSFALAGFADSTVGPVGSGAEPSAMTAPLATSPSGLGWAFLLKGALTMKTAAALLITLVAAISVIFVVRDSSPLSQPELDGSQVGAVEEPKLAGATKPSLETPAGDTGLGRSAIAASDPAQREALGRSASLLVLDERGAPVEGALAEIVDLQIHVQTNANGRASVALPEIAADVVGAELVVSRVGYLTAQKSVALGGPEQNDLGEIRLVRSAIIRGRVVDSNGDGVPGAIVFTAEPGTHPTTFVANVAGGLDAHRSAQARDTADAEGAFTLESVRPGELRVWAGVGGGLSYGSSALLEVVGGSVAEDVDVHLSAAPGVDSIAGFVAFPQKVEGGSSVVWARYLSQEGMRTRTAPVAANGSFQVVVEADAPHDLWVMESHPHWDAHRHVFRGKRELADWRGVVEPAIAPGTHDVLLRMERAPWFTVEASTFGGEELERFELGIIEYDGSDLTVEIPWSTQAESGERFAVPAARFYVTIAAEGFTKEWLGPFAPDSEPGRLKAVLEPLPSVSGLILDPQGDPVPGALVEFYAKVPDTSRVHSRGMRLRTKAAPAAVAKAASDGEFNATLRVSGAFFVRASAPSNSSGWAPVLSGPFEIEHQIGRDDLELCLTRGGAITGTVLVAPGDRPTGTLVGASNGSPFVRRMVVPEDGTFRFEGLPPGEWSVTALREDTERSTTRNSREALPWESNCIVTDGRVTEIDLDLSGFAACSVEGGFQIGPELRGGWQVALNRWSELGPGEGERVDGTTVAEDGTFVLVATEPGPYVLFFERAQGQDRILMMEEIDLTLGVTAWDRRIGLGAVEGHVNQELHAADRIALTTEHAGLAAAILVRPDDRGRFRVPAVPIGEGRLRYTEMPPSDSDPRRWPVLEELQVSEGRVVSVGGE